MTRVYKALCLVLLLVAAQQGAVVHELSHVAGAHGMDFSAAAAGATGAADGACAQCPSFAQASAATFSHSFELPALLRTGIERSRELRVAVAGTAIPRARSRGPPSLS